MRYRRIHLPAAAAATLLSSLRQQQPAAAALVCRAAAFNGGPLRRPLLLLRPSTVRRCPDAEPRSTVATTTMRRRLSSGDADMDAEASVDPHPPSASSSSSHRQYFLLKSEPSEYSITSLRTAVQDDWDGVRNYEARNILRSMNVGDQCFFYHSSCRPPLGPGIAGICSIIETAKPDETQFDSEGKGYDPKSSRENPKWDRVRVKFVLEFDDVLLLKELKEEAERNPDGAVADMDVLRRKRLSVTKVTEGQWTAVMDMIEAKEEEKKTEKDR